MAYQQDPPFSVQIELCEGCNLRCSFCGLNGIRDKDNDYKFMYPDTLVNVINQIVDAEWNPRIEFAMHGEPTMHPAYIRMIKMARLQGPTLHLMMTSNGSGLLRKPGAMENIKALFDAGLNVLALDNYENVNFVPKLLERLGDPDNVDANELFGNMNLQIYDYPKEKEGNPHTRRRPHEHVLTIIRDISKADRGTHSRLSNHAGAAAPLTDSHMGKRCAKPFREMSIRWNGNVAICCDDWRGVYKCGNVVKDGLVKVWHGPNFKAARRKLILGERDFGPCQGCNARSYRTGLLPDKKGLVVLPKPDKTDHQVIKTACEGRPYTTPIVRPWEKIRQTP